MQNMKLKRTLKSGDFCTLVRIDSFNQTVVETIQLRHISGGKWAYYRRSGALIAYVLPSDTSSYLLFDEVLDNLQAGEPIAGTISLVDEDPEFLADFLRRYNLNTGFNLNIKVEAKEDAKQGQ